MKRESTTAWCHWKTLWPLPRRPTWNFCSSNPLIQMRKISTREFRFASAWMSASTSTTFNERWSDPSSRLAFMLSRIRSRSSNLAPILKKTTFISKSIVHRRFSRRATKSVSQLSCVGQQSLPQSSVSNAPSRSYALLLSSSTVLARNLLKSVRFLEDQSVQPSPLIKLKGPVHIALAIPQQCNTTSFSTFRSLCMYSVKLALYAFAVVHHNRLLSRVL
mmetsp:Transcript_13536/g.26105  ORF Transcript_13536/g.26105 Transcript_13536/m.26105 type:complete len:219 (-) Transcript_13536:536-1192(-)